jgi:hypothetical protein
MTPDNKNKLIYNFDSSPKAEVIHRTGTETKEKKNILVSKGKCPYCHSVPSESANSELM